MAERKAATETPETKLARLNTRFLDEWICVRSDLFGDVTLDGFEAEHYNNFLNQVGSLDDLLTGLEYYDPIFDQALNAAKQMSEEDFQKFKEQLAHERIIAGDFEAESQIQNKFLPILIPDNFLHASTIAEKFEVSWGLACYKLKQIELEDKINGNN